MVEVRKNGQILAGGNWARHLMAAACIAAGLGLSACDSPVETAHEAQRDASDAARLAGSAGTPRAKEAFFTKVNDGSIEKDANGDLKKLAGRIYTDDTHNDPKLFADMVEQNPASKDLDEATKKITDALKFDTSPALKSALEAESGNIQLQYSSERFQAAQDPLVKVARLAAAVQTLAQAAIDLGAEAGALTDNAKPPSSAAVEAARAKLTQATQATTGAQAEVARIEKEITDKQAQSRTIYTATDAAFAAAEGLKGQAAIDADKKAAQDRNAAEALTEEVVNLEPPLIKARSALAAATIGQKDAEGQLAAAQGAYEAAVANAKLINDRIAALREAAKNMVAAPQTGIQAQYEALVAAAAEADGLLKAASTHAESAQKAYLSSAQDLAKSLSELHNRIEEAGIAARDSKDPLIHISSDRRPSAIMAWNQAAAADQIGRINTAGLIAANLLATSAAQAGAAAKAAGSPAVDAANGSAAKQYREAAIAGFTSAIAAADLGINQPANADLDKIKWIGLSLKAYSQYGLAHVIEGPAAAAAMTQAAQTVKDAVARNADLKPSNFR